MKQTDAPFVEHCYSQFLERSKHEFKPTEFSVFFEEHTDSFGVQLQETANQISWVYSAKNENESEQSYAKQWFFLTTMMRLQ